MAIVFRVTLAAGLVLSSAAFAGEGIQIKELAPLPKPVTSFGAAIVDGWLYAYGGHLGSAHKYSADLQARELVRLNLAQPDKWEVVAAGPPRTGLAMVAYGGKLYRIGGWEAKNAAGDKWELYSSRDFARFDPQSGQWQDLAPLPEGRSSHDAAVLGSQLYVIGGWELKGEGGGEWHETAYVCDLADANPQWKEIAKPPFNRRALAVATYGGKVYVIGGMDDSNDTTTDTNIYDPKLRAWSKGPAMPGKAFDGFGASAFGTAAGLFATTGVGSLYRLSADGQTWEEVGKLKHPRFFHRLLAEGDNKLLVVGGTSRGGKVPEVESLQLTLAERAP
jgi:N-acetylneuraminic acid mutarotase